LGDIAHDGEAKARARYALVEPFAAFHGAGTFFGREPRTIVLHREEETAAIQRPRRDGDLAVCPFAGIVDEVAGHLFKVLALAAKRQTGGDVDIDPEFLFGVHSLEHPG